MMIYKKPQFIRDLFSVFFTVTKNDILKLSFIFLTLFTTVNLGLFYITSRLIYPGIGIAITIFIDIYMITAFQMIISADIKSYLENKKSITFSEIFSLLSEKSFYLVSHPFLVLVFMIGSLLLISLDSMILNIPQAGPFFYSITFILFFLFGLFFVVNLILAIASTQLYPTLLAERDLKLIPLYKKIWRLFYYSWPKLIVANIINITLTAFFAIVSIIIFAFVIYIMLYLTSYFNDLSFDNELLYLFSSFPSGNTLINILADTTNLPVFSAHQIAYIPTSFRIAGFFLGISLYLIAILTFTLSTAYSAVSNYYIYHIVNNTLPNDH